MLEVFKKLIDYVLHIDVHLIEIVNNYGNLTYLILFLIVFCETGLVVTPFLPGDSLFFAAGAICASSDLNIWITISICLVAAIVGNTVNYSIGRYLGPKMYQTNSRWIKKEYLDKTHAFYEKHGAKAIVLCRFLPIFRTFVPFVAGIAGMNAFVHFIYNVIGAILWVGLFVMGGYLFGNIPAIKNNFSLVILIILIVTVLPAVYAVVKGRFSKSEKSEKA